MAREVLGVAGAVIGSAFGPQGAQIGFMIGSTVGALIDPPNFDGPKLNDAALQTSRDGIPISIGWGITHQVGNIVAMNPIVETKQKSGGKKSGGTTTNIIRKRTFGIGIGRGIEGPIVGLLRVWENNKLIYDVNDGSSFPASDNAAFESATTLYLGTETQLPDPELESHSGVGDTPAYRGLAYIVFNNKDLTSFGSSIPTYRFEICAGSGFLPASTLVDADEGYAATQHTFYAGAVADFTHPFQGDSYSEFFMMAVFQNASVPLLTDNRGMFNLYNGTFGTQFNVKGRFGPSYFWEFVISGNATGTPRIVVGNDFEITIDHPTWGILDWYCIAMAYSEPLNTATAMLINLSLGQETSYSPPVQNNDLVEWETASDGDSKSHVMYGYADPDPIGGGPPTTPDTGFQGNLSQILIHNTYVNLTSAGIRRTLCGTNGVINLGSSGQIPFGERPLIYMPNGHPSTNVGTKFLGNFGADFFVRPPFFTGTETPPEAT